MSADADTHTAATAYGEIEVEVVECASCGAEVARDSAEPFTIGEDPVVREGWACEHCATEGPADFPHADAFPFRLLVGFTPFFAAYGTCDVLDPDTALSPNSRAYLAGVYGTLLTGAILGALWLLITATVPAGEVPL